MPDYTILSYLYPKDEPAGEPFKLTIHDDDERLDWFGQDEGAPETVTIDGKELTVRGSSVMKLGFTTADGQQLTEDMVFTYVDELGWLITPAKDSEFGEGSVITDYLGWLDYGIPHDKFADFAGIDDDDDDYVCFVTGTLIDTPEGPRRVETLRPGDIVLTANAGPQPILWTGASPIPRNDPRARPIEIPPQALGPGMPAHPIRLSPRHRVRVPGWLAQLAAGRADAFAPVSALVGHRGIRPVPAGATQRYHHLLLPVHGALICSGLPCESLYPGAVALRAMSRPARRSLQAAFPRLAADPDSYGPTAYPCLTPHEVRAFLRRPPVASRAHGTPPQTLPDPARSPHQRLAGG